MPTTKQQESEHYVIESVTEDGKSFRPSDWVERICSALGSFGPDQRLRYSAHVFPCVIQGEKCLVVSRDLAQADPAAFAFVLQFARDNKLKIQADRRQQTVPVSQDRRDQNKQGA